MGGIPISVESENNLFIELVKYGFKKFLDEYEKPQLVIRVVIDDTKDTNAYIHFHPHNLKVVVENSKLFSRSSCYSGMFDANTLTAEVKQGLALAPFYLFLRFVLCVYLPMADGFFIHAASIEKDRKCFLFSGKPQSGKSTVVKLSSGYRILSDDFSIIRKKHDSFRGFGSPFWGHIEARGGNIKNKMGCIPIKGIYFLKQDDKVYIRKLTRKNAVLELVKNIAIISKNKFINNRIIQLAEEFVGQIPAYYLYFKLDNSFWRRIQ